MPLSSRSVSNTLGLRHGRGRAGQRVQPHQMSVTHTQQQRHPRWSSSPIRAVAGASPAAAGLSCSHWQCMPRHTAHLRHVGAWRSTPALQPCPSHPPDGEPSRLSSSELPRASRLQERSRLNSCSSNSSASAAAPPVPQGRLGSACSLREGGHPTEPGEVVAADAKAAGQGEGSRLCDTSAHSCSGTALVQP